MRTAFQISLVLMLLLVLPGLIAADGENEKLSERIEELIDALGAETFKARQDASEALEKIGKKALPALEKAAKQSDDPEMRSRCQRLIEKIKGMEPPDVRRPNIKPRFPRMRGPEELEELMRRMLGRNLEGLGGIQRRSVVDADGRHDFVKSRDGRIKVTVTKGTDKTERSFASEAEMKAKAPALYKKWQSGGMFQMRIIRPGNGDLEKMLDSFRQLMPPEMRKQLEEMGRGRNFGGGALERVRERLMLRMKQFETESLRKQLKQLRALRPDLKGDALKEQLDKLRALDAEALREELAKLAPNLGELRRELEQTLRLDREKLESYKRQLERLTRRVPELIPPRREMEQPKVEQPFRDGVKLAPVDPALQAQLGFEGGAVVRAVKQGPDATFGLQVNDIVLRVNGDAVSGPADYHAALTRHARAQRIRVEILRRGQKQTLDHEFK